MLPELPILVILPLDKLVLHEQHDEVRAAGLAEKLKRAGVLRNPPIISPLQDRSNRYLVLDGANRVSSLRGLGIAHVLAQVVQLDDPQLTLETWNHVIWEFEPAELLARLRAIPEIVLLPAIQETSREELAAARALAALHQPGEMTYTLWSKPNRLADRVERLNTIVDAYATGARMDRTNLRSVETLSRVYDRLGGLIIFPRFSVEEVAYIAGGGRLFPSGLTRFTVSPRVLHVDYPLDRLAAEGPLAVKNQQLQEWLQDRLARKAVRFYAEATFLFDE